MKKLMALIMIVGILNADFIYAQEILREVVVRSDREHINSLPDISGTKIYNGKKTSIIDIQAAPVIVNSNYRQALQKTPGLLLSEETTPLFSVGYRGLDPHRAQFTQVMKDGIPIHADMLGYPEAYYVPALESVDHIDFIQGGGSLLYGPQPGGALNFVTKDPYQAGSLQLVEQNTGGSNGFYSNYTSLSGTQGNNGYYGYVHHRQSQGFRAHNSQYDVFDGGGKWKYALSDTKKVTLNFDAYHEKHGEPGGLTRSDFDVDLTKTNRFNDRFELNRYFVSLAYDQDIDDDMRLECKLFGGYYERLSWRQRTSVSSFGTSPSGASASSNDIESQKFYTGGTETRVKKDYQGIGDTDNTLSAGFLYYHVTSPRSDKRGSTADAIDGTLRKSADRWLNYVSVFAEHMTEFEQLTLTPGVRLENIWQVVEENINLDKTTVPLANESQYDVVPLFGLGVIYDFTEKNQSYFNISQGYRPKTYTQSVPTGSGQVVNGDLQEGKSWQLDTGLRGKPAGYYNWDIGYFFMSFKDQIGTSGSTVENVGDAYHQGLELANELDIIGVYDALRDTPYTQNLNSLNLFANAMVLEAHFSHGPNKSKTPQYAPDFIFKTGLEYNYAKKAKVRFAGTFVDDHFANDTNTSQFLVPSYKIWDLTAELNVYKDSIKLLGGINNLFNERYFARVRSDGIDPANGRNYYAGAKIIW